MISENSCEGVENMLAIAQKLTAEIGAEAADSVKLAK